MGGEPAGSVSPRPQCAEAQRPDQKSPGEGEKPGRNRDGLLTKCFPYNRIHDRKPKSKCKIREKANS